MKDCKKVRHSLIRTACAMNRQGLNQGSSGNISVRVKKGFIITPSALPYDKCMEDDLVFVDYRGKSEGKRKPSSEWRLHRDIYKNRTEAGAILHCHSPWATTLACLEREIPAFHYMVAVAGGNSVPLAPYALFGSNKLSRFAVKALQDRCACLLAHHGLVCFSTDLESVFNLALEVEYLARLYVQALQVAEPSLLGNKEMEKVLTRFATYKSAS